MLHKYYIVSCSSLTGCRRVHLLDYVRLDPCCKVCYFCVLAEDQKGQIRSNAYNKERPNDLRSNLVYALLCKNAMEGWLWCVYFCIFCILPSTKYPMIWGGKMIVLEYRVKGLIGSLEVFSLNTNSFRPSCGYTLTLTCDVAYILNTVKKEKVHFITLYFVLFCKKVQKCWKSTNCTMVTLISKIRM